MSDARSQRASQADAMQRLQSRTRVSESAGWLLRSDFLERLEGACASFGRLPNTSAPAAWAEAIASLSFPAEEINVDASPVRT